MAEKNIVQLAITCIIAVVVVAVVMIPIINSIASDNGNGGSGGGSSDPPAEGVLWNLDEPGYLAWEAEHSSFYLDSYSLPNDLVEEIEVEIDGNTETLNGIKLTYEDIQSYGLSFGYIADDASYRQVMFLDANSPVEAYMVIAPDRLAYFDGTTASMAWYDGATFYTNIPLPGLYRSVPVQFAVDNVEESEFEYGYPEGYSTMYNSGIGDPYYVDEEQGYYFYNRYYTICVDNGGQYTEPGESPTVSTLRSIDITNLLEGVDTSALSSYAVGFRGIYPSGVSLTVNTDEGYSAELGSSVYNTYTEAEAVAEGILDVYDNGKYKVVYLMPTVHTANLPGGPNTDYYGWGADVSSATIDTVEQPPYDAAEYVTENPSGGDNGNGNSDLGAAGTILKVIPIFVILGIILYAVQYFRAGKNGL